MGNYVLAPAAREDLRSVAEYVAGVAGTEIAIRLIESLQSKCQLLADLPGELGTPRDELRRGIRSFPVSSYVLFFRYEAHELQVVRVLHQRQDASAHIPEGD